VVIAVPISKGVVEDRIGEIRPTSLLTLVLAQDAPHYPKRNNVHLAAEQSDTAGRRYSEMPSTILHAAGPWLRVVILAPGMGNQSHTHDEAVQGLSLTSLRLI
jgi:hypothetical protein